MTDKLIDLIDDADLMEVDGNSIRHFGLDIDGVEDDDDAILVVEMTDENFDKYEWFFTTAELTTATFNPRTKEWTVLYGDEDYPVTIVLYKLTPILPGRWY